MSTSAPTVFAPLRQECSLFKTCVISYASKAGWLLFRKRGGLRPCNFIPFQIQQKANKTPFWFENPAISFPSKPCTYFGDTPRAVWEPCNFIPFQTLKMLPFCENVSLSTLWFFSKTRSATSEHRRMFESCNFPSHRLTMSSLFELIQAPCNSILFSNFCPCFWTQAEHPVILHFSKANICTPCNSKISKIWGDPYETQRQRRHNQYYRSPNTWCRSQRGKDQRNAWFYRFPPSLSENLQTYLVWIRIPYLRCVSFVLCWDLWYMSLQNWA